MNINIVADATEYVNLGMMITPVPIGSKAPRLPGWTDRYVAPDEFLPTDRIGIVCGFQMDGTSLLVGDLDHRPDRNLLAEETLQRFLDIAKTRSYWQKLFVTRSTSGKGYHIYARAHKSARKSNLIIGGVHVGEMIGVGGQVVAQPEEHWIMGTPASMTPMSDDEARQFCLDLGYQIPQKPQPAPAVTRTHKRPGDDFNERGDITPILIAHGWQLLKQRGNESFWCRPGKDRGISATYGFHPGIFYNFSSNVDGLPEGPHTHFSLLAHLEHGGNFRSAAGALRAQGYGDPMPTEGAFQKAWLAQEEHKGGRPATHDFLHLYNLLAETAVGNTTNITNAELAQRLGRSERTVTRWLTTCEDRGLLSRRQTTTGRWIDLRGVDNNLTTVSVTGSIHDHQGGCGGETPVYPDYRQCTTCKIGELAPDAAGVARCSYCEQAIPPVIIATEALEAFAPLRKAARLEASVTYVQSSRPDLSTQRIQKLLERTQTEMLRRRQDETYVAKLRGMTDSTLLREVKNAHSRVERATSHGQAWIFERMAGLADAEDCRRESLREALGAYDRHSVRKRPGRHAEQGTLL
jgi:hypothetical protein